MPQRPGLRQWVLSIVALALVCGCAPPRLTETSDAGRLDPDADESPPVQFRRVAELMRNNCANAGCHNQKGNAGLTITNGPSASDTEVRKALEGETISDGQTKFVEPGNPAESAIFQAISGMRGRTSMPPGERLAPDKVEMIRRWIAQGALYE